MGFGNVNDLIQIACKHIKSMRQSYKKDFVEIRLIFFSCCAIWIKLIVVMTKFEK